MYNYELYDSVHRGGGGGGGGGTHEEASQSDLPTAIHKAQELAVPGEATRRTVFRPNG